MPKSGEDDDWKLENSIGLAEAEQAGVKRRLHNLKDSGHNKKKKVPETVAEAFELAKKLLQGACASDILTVCEVQAEPPCKMEGVPHDVSDEVEASKMKVKKL